MHCSQILTNNIMEEVEHVLEITKSVISYFSGIQYLLSPYNGPDYRFP